MSCPPLTKNAINKLSRGCKERPVVIQVSEIEQIPNVKGQKKFKLTLTKGTPTK